MSDDSTATPDQSTAPATATEGQAKPCPVCGGTRSEEIARGPDYEYRSLPGDFAVLQCQDCGHAHLDPVPPIEHLQTIYPPTYYTVNPRSPIAFSPFIQKTKMKKDVGRIVSLSKDRELRSVVDLGCGDAERLARVKAVLGDSVQCTGVDFQPDEARVKELAERGVRMVTANIEGGLDELEDGAHDLFIMCQIIEHLYDPAEALKSIAKKLRPGGRVLMETPNLGGLDYRLQKKTYWGGYHFPRHFHVFTRGSLQRIVDDAGLRTAKKGFIPSGFGIVGLRNKLGLSSIEPGRSFWEFISMKNLAVVGAFTVSDLLTIAIGGHTSNQFLLAEKPAD
ncbi:MAG: methyltransferase domain-containing protein [Planctomycetota bacterium]